MKSLKQCCGGQSWRTDRPQASEALEAPDASARISENLASLCLRRCTFRGEAASMFENCDAKGQLAHSAWGFRGRCWSCKCDLKIGGCGKVWSQIFGNAWLGSDQASLVAGPSW